MRQDPARPHIVATGGKENALKVWDLQGSEEPLFRAKNVSDGGWRGPGSQLPGVEATDYKLETGWVLGDDDRGQKEGAHWAPPSSVPHLLTPPGTEWLARPAGSHLGPGHTVPPRVTEARHLYGVPPGEAHISPLIFFWAHIASWRNRKLALCRHGPHHLAQPLFSPSFCHPWAPRRRTISPICSSRVAKPVTFAYYILGRVAWTVILPVPPTWKREGSVPFIVESHGARVVRRHGLDIKRTGTWSWWQPLICFGTQAWPSSNIICNIRSPLLSSIGKAQLGIFSAGFFFFFSFWPRCMAVIPPWSGIESKVEAQSPNHWTTREFEILRPRQDWVGLHLPCVLCSASEVCSW